MKKYLYVLLSVSLLLTGCQSNEANEPTQNDIHGALPGKFSIAEKKQIQFSQGNLQYQGSTNTWRFAPHQWTIVGEDNYNISSSYSGWIDLFGWGTGNNPTKYTRNDNSYSVFVDWGVNAIDNGGKQPNEWRALTKDEWDYLFFKRPQATTLFAFGKVHGINGLILLPDDWVLPEGLTFYSGFRPYTEYGVGAYVSKYTNVYSEDEWTKMEKNGAVFLPKAGYRSGGGPINGEESPSVGYINEGEGYWTASPAPAEDSGHDLAAYSISMRADILSLYHNTGRMYGLAVRLVKE